jgi:4'-phosphopantetheinyl transferase EntD
MESLRERIAQALGPSVAFAIGDPRRTPPSALLPEEAAAVRRAVPQRQRELAWGRHLAREALAELGGAPVALPPRPDRRPAWPDGFVGSISHSAARCAVLVAPRFHLRTVGLDIEPDVPLEAELVPIVMTASERHRENVSGDRPSATAKLFFVLKEAYYKAQYELTETLLDFSEVEVELEGEDGFVATCARTQIEPLHGRFVREDGHIWAWVGLRR